jgi:hypothetical protein
MKIPLGNVKCWPRGARLRFRHDADVQPKYMHVRGTDVVVFGGPFLKSPADGNARWAVRQKILAYAIRGYGWARPEQLEPRPDLPDPPSMVEDNCVKARNTEDLVVG